jgi:DNA-binding NtrC family response regulator
MVIAAALELGQVTNNAAQALGAYMDREQATPAGSPAALSGRRILIVEDSPVVSAACEDMLSDMGCVGVGPAANMAAALQLASEEALDAAIVDINIRGGKAFPVLKILSQRGVPFLLASGYADWSMPDEWLDSPRLAKPYTPALLRDSLLKLLGA